MTSARRHIEEAKVDAEAEITGEEWSDGSSCCSSDDSAGLDCHLAPLEEGSMPTASRQVLVLD